MLHTCKHNKNLEDRSDLAWFKKSTQEICPKTYEMYEATSSLSDPIAEMFNNIAK